MKHLSLTFIIIIASIFTSNATEIIKIKATTEDITETIREAIANTTEKEIQIIFEKGVYHLSPEYATDKYTNITNHGNGLKKIAFLFENFESVEIEGNGSELIFSGQIAPFQFYKCNKTKINNLVIDWETPFTFQGEVIAVNPKEAWRDIKPNTKGFSWKLKNDRLIFPNIDNFNYHEIGSTLEFDKDKKRVVHGAYDFSSRPRWVEQRENGVLRFHEKLKHYPKVGNILHSKGPHEQNRYAPAFHFASSKNITLNNIIIHHALGMGFLFERSETIKITNSGIYVREGSERVVSTTADATHFCNCKGNILIENCIFKHMLDDGTNVHGTYVEVNQIISENTLRIGLKHFEQTGYIFAEPNDEIWFIEQPSSKRAYKKTIVEVKYINDKYVDLTFDSNFSKKLKPGDVLENKTWNPTFTMRGCIIKDHRARNIVLKTPEKILIENNEFSSMMSSIFFRGETYHWFESGAVQNVVIKNNTFNYCAYSGMEHAVLYITPRLGANFDRTELYDRNISFVGNTINTFDNRIVWADRVDGLKISKNTINQIIDKDKPQLHPNRYMFDLKNCNNVIIDKNIYNGTNEFQIHADEQTNLSLKVKKNKNITKKNK